MNLPEQQEFDAARVEAMLKAAGGYVEPSPDLRPRVLEEARQLRWSGQRRLRLTMVGGTAMAAAVLLSVQASTMSQSLSDATPAQRIEQLVATQNAASKSTSGSFWALVDAFFTVRNEQADAFHPGRSAAGSATNSAAAAEETSESAAQTAAADGSF